MEIFNPTQSSCESATEDLVAKLAALMASPVLATSVSAAHTFPRQSAMAAAVLLDEVMDIVIL